jgi:hypothetical protein
MDEMSIRVTRGGTKSAASNRSELFYGLLVREGTFESRNPNSGLPGRQTATGETETLLDTPGTSNVLASVPLYIAIYFKHAPTRSIAYFRVLDVLI